MGDSVPADARVFEAVNLEADEALLTGESVPVRKDPDQVYDDENVGPGDRANVIFSSSIITKGRGKAVVFATGMCTEIGAIAAALEDDGTKKRKVRRDKNGRAGVWEWVEYGVLRTWDWVGEFLGLNVGTPLQRKLSRLFWYVFLFAVVCFVVVLAANKVSFWLQGWMTELEGKGRAAGLGSAETSPTVCGPGLRLWGTCPTCKGSV